MRPDRFSTTYFRTTKMRDFYDSLSEKDRRRYAAIEAEKLGYGGASYIRQLFNCDNRTILHGKQDLELDLLKENTGVRQLGDGRKSIMRIKSQKKYN